MCDKKLVWIVVEQKVKKKRKKIVDKYLSIISDIYVKDKNLMIHIKRVNKKITDSIIGFKDLAKWSAINIA